MKMHKQSKELKVAVIRKEQTVPVVITPHKGFIACMAVLLQSIMDHADDKNFYDIIILHSEVPEEAQSRFAEMLSEKDNFSIRFFDVAGYITNYAFFRNLLKKRSPYITTFYRLLIPELLCGYEKTVYLDADTVVNVDLARLMEIDISGHTAAAVRDIGGNGDYYDENGTLKEYRDHILKLKRPDDYFNAGVFVLNIREFVSRHSKEEWWELVNSRDWRSKDQDVLNMVCNERVYILPSKWNYVTFLRKSAEKYILEEDQKDRQAAAQDPYIIHYVGRFKPWSYCNIEFFDVFWKYALKSPFFEDNFNMIGEDRLVGQILERADDGRVNMRTILLLIKAWCKTHAPRFFCLR